MHPKGHGAEAIALAKRIKSQDHKYVLDCLVTAYKDGHLYTFKYVSEQTGLNATRVRIIARHLARKGLAEWDQAFSYDGNTVQGSGYWATPLGRTVNDLIKAWDNDKAEEGASKSKRG